ncbi:MAG: hypothetical protein GOU98_03585 [Candidatus Altiarchaeota archaeon]|nr:hypothetical protein [Candidatus Altiarchaeota archaeon]
MVIVLGLMIVLIAGFLPSSTLQETKEVLILSKQAGALGSDGYTYQHINLASNLVLSKGIEGTPLLTQAGPIEVAKGAITAQEHTIEFEVPDHVRNKLSSASLSFRIVDTNKYGPLKINLNGVDVWSQTAVRGQTISIDLPLSQILSENIVRITAGSSGWRLWSPTFYIMEDIQVSERLSSGEEKSFSFKLTDEQLEKFNKGRIYIGNVNPVIQGELAMILNEERVIFRGVPGKGSVINSFSSGVKEDNTITFKLIEDGHYEMSNIEVIVFTSANSTGGFSSDFSIPLEDLSKMRSGTTEGVIEINVLSSSGDYPLSVIIAGETEAELYNQVTDEGQLVLRFTGFEASISNTLVINSVGDYNLGLVNIKLVRK